MRMGFGRRIQAEKADFHLTSLDFESLSRAVIYFRPHLLSLLAAVTAMLFVVAASVARPWILKGIIDELAGGGSCDNLFVPVAAIAGLTAAVWLFGYVRSVVGLEMGEKILFRIRRDVFSNILDAPVSVFRNEGIGNSLALLTEDVDALASFVSQGMVTVIGDSATVVFVLALMARMSPVLALGTLPMICVLTGGLVVVGALLRRAARLEREAAAALLSNIEEGLAGIKVNKSLLREATSLEQVKGANLRTVEARVTAAGYFGSIFPVISVASALGLASVLALGTREVSAGRISIGVVFAFVAYLRLLLGPLRELSLLSRTLANAGAALERLAPYMSANLVTPGTVGCRTRRTRQITADGAGPACLVGAGADAGGGWNFRGSLSLSGLSFSYGDRDVLKNVSIDIPAKENLLIVGASGAGKSTLAWLLGGLLKPDRGSVMLDETPFEKIDNRVLREQVKVLTQDVFLFSGTVRGNIARGRPGAPDEDIVKAVESVGIASVIDSLPDGLDTRVGEGGVLLSGGQRKLLALARLALLDPKVVILDEPLASVDSRRIRLVKEALLRLLNGRTAVITSHRLAELDWSGRIAVIADQTIIQTGTHDELLRICPEYALLADTR